MESTLQSSSTTNGRVNLPGAAGYQRHVLTVTSKPFILWVYQRANAMGPWGLLSRAMQGGPALCSVRCLVCLVDAVLTWSDSSDFPDWTLSDINHDHSTMNLVALQKQWEQNRSDVSKAQTTWFDSLQYWHRLTLGRSYLYAGNQLAPWQWRVYRNLTSKCKGGALRLDENWDVIFKSPVVSCRTFAMWCCRWLGILLYHWCFDWKEATDH